MEVSEQFGIASHTRKIDSSVLFEFEVRSDRDPNNGTNFKFSTLAGTLMTDAPDVLEMPLTARLAEKICASAELTPPSVRVASQDRHPRHDRRDAGGHSGAMHADPAQDARGRRRGRARRSIFGTDRRTSALDATLSTAPPRMLSTIDDFSGVLGGHHSVPLVATLFAAGRGTRRHRPRSFAAYVVGVETEIRLARAVNFHHYDKGWHPTATLGTFGAAAAAAHLFAPRPAAHRHGARHRRLARRAASRPISAP